MRDVSLSTLEPVAFTDVEAVRGYLDISDTSQDTNLGRIIDAASGMIEKFCDTLFSTASRVVTETIIPEFTVYSLDLRYAPLHTLTSVTIDDAAQTLSDYLQLKPLGMIRRKDKTSFAIAGQTIVVVYKAGYGDTAAVMPKEIPQAATALAADMFRTKDRESGLTAESVADVASRSYGDRSSYVLGANGVYLPPNVAALLRPYMQRGIA